MKIGVDTIGLKHGRSGVAFYLSSFLHNLHDLREDVTIELFGTEVDRYTYGNESNYIYNSFVTYDGFPENFWHRRMMPSFVKKNNYDLVFFKVGQKCYPFTGKVKGVAVVHEIISESLKHIDSAMERKLLLKSLQNSHAIISSSQYVKNDMVQLGIDPEKIHVIYTGVDHQHFFPKTDFTDEFVTISPFSIKRPFFIYPSSITDYEKNHINLVNGFSFFKEKTSLPHRLVLAGSEGQISHAVHELVTSCPANSDIFLTGYFPHQNLPDLLSSAEACVYPSSIEGSGVPVLEALASGIPVICSKSGVLPEITGGNAMFFDSNNANEICECLEKIASDKEFKDKLVKDGIAWAEKFSWQKNIEETYRLIKQILR